MEKKDQILNKENIFEVEEIDNDLESKYMWERIIKWWSGFSLRTKLLAIATLVVSLLMTGITFFALNSIQRDAGMNDTRYARDLGLLLSGNVTELVANNQKNEISNVAEKFWRSSRNLRYIFFTDAEDIVQLGIPISATPSSSNNQFQLTRKLKLPTELKKRPQFPLVRQHSTPQGQVTDVFVPMLWKGEYLGTLALGVTPNKKALASAALTREVTVAVFISIWVLVILGAVLNALTITRPVRELVRGVREISQGNFKSRVSLPMTGELGELLTCFNKMASQLENYDSMLIKPGTAVNNDMVSKDLNSIYSSGWFSGVQIKFEDGPLGVKLIVIIVPNPILQEVQINPESVVIPKDYINEIFNEYYGMTLNLNELQERMNLIKQWYEERGYSLSRVNSPERISSDGLVELRIDEGIVSNVELRFIGPDETIRSGKTKDWVIRRELQTISGAVFNRITLENDIKRLYGTALFSDIKVSLAPDVNNPGQIIITLDISEQRTGSLTGGIGYSNSGGIFAQLGLQESNAFGRSWSSTLNINFGQYSTTYNFALADPWIRGDRYRTAFKTNIYLSRNYPQEFKSEDNGNLYAVDDQVSNSSDTFSSIVLENFGGGFSFIRPLNGGDPFSNAAWKLQLGMNFKLVKMMDSDRNERPFATREPTTANISEIICIGYTSPDGSCPSENTLISFLVSASRNRLNSSVNPTSGNVLRFGTEQFISLGNDSPTFNRMRISYSWFIPTRLINLTEGCKSDDSDSNSCPQTIGIQLKAGSIIGELPPYEAFCMGGSSSVRGWSSCDLAVSRSFLEATIEYRFPVWRMISGS